MTINFDIILNLRCKKKGYNLFHTRSNVLVTTASVSSNECSSNTVTALVLLVIFSVESVRKELSEHVKHHFHCIIGINR